MEISRKVIKILEPSRFTSQKNGNEYVRHTFILETAGQYPKKIAFSVMGDDRYNQLGIVVGGNYNVSFDVESREWNGRWYTELSAWRAQSLNGTQNNANATAQAPQQAATSAPQAQGGTSDANGGDMPF